MIRYCDGTGGRLVCPHPEDCTVSCWFDEATLASRKAKVSPIIQLDPEQEIKEWRSIDDKLAWASRAMVAVILAWMLVGLYSAWRML